MLCFQVDTFSKDPSDPEKLWFVSNGLDRFIVRTMDFSGLSGPNFRVMWCGNCIFTAVNLKR